MSLSDHPGSNVYADFDGSGTLQERYLDGPATDEVLARTSGSGVTAWYLSDNEGSVRDIVSTSGTELDHIAYDPYGQVISESSSANGDRFKYNGMQFDQAIGAYYDNARYYDPVSGRFLEQDPTGFRAGDANLNRFVGNNPTNSIDVSGLEGEPRPQKMGKSSNSQDVDPGNVVSPPNAVVPVSPPNVVVPRGTTTHPPYLGRPWIISQQPSGLPPGAILDQLPPEVRQLIQGIDQIWGQLIPDEQEAVLDLLSMLLDAGGVVEPTPFCDLASTALSAYRGEYFGAALSFLGVVSYLGDAAKLGKLGSYAEKMTKIGSVIRKNPVLQAAVTPILKKLDNLLAAAINKAPKSVGDQLRKVKKAVADLLGGCFAAGTPLLVPGGHKRIEDFRRGDYVLALPEHDFDAVPVPRLVEEVFENFLPVMALRIGPVEIRTTIEHPFWVDGRGWTAANLLVEGDRLRSHDGSTVVLTRIEYSVGIAKVYNMRIAEYHTYFVGETSWGFSIWTHNTDDCIPDGSTPKPASPAPGAPNGGLGSLVKVNNADPAADALAKKLGGESRVKFANGPDNEFDAVSDLYIAQTKPANFKLGSRFRDQAKTTFETAQATGRTPYFHFDGPPEAAVLNQLQKYAQRYGIQPVIDISPL